MGKNHNIVLNLLYLFFVLFVFNPPGLFPKFNILSNVNFIFNVSLFYLVKKEFYSKRFLQYNTEIFIS